MKKFRLKKSIPGIKKGAIFKQKDFGNYVCPYDQPHQWDYLEFRKDIVENDKEFFEEIK